MFREGFTKKDAEKSGDLPNRGGGGHPEPNSIFEKKVFQGPHRTILGHPKHVHSQKIKLGVIFFYAEKDQTGVGGSREVWQITRLVRIFFVKPSLKFIIIIFIKIIMTTHISCNNIGKDIPPLNQKRGDEMGFFWNRLFKNLRNLLINLCKYFLFKI